MTQSADEAEDSRDVWDSRISFIFAATGGAVGLGNVLRLFVAHSVSSEDGAGVGCWMSIFGIVSSVLLSSDPTTYSPEFFFENTIMRRFWYLTSCSGNQLTPDLNATISIGGQWNIPAAWGFVLNYYAAPTFNIVVPEHERLRVVYPIMGGIIFSRANAEVTLDIDGVLQNAGDSTVEAQEVGGEGNLTP
ncbi:Sodium:neurotransmitter symporter family protein [Colletotrichum orchidophilum]|uniref:Sodium:neurotransmitter symporter family protein n=1 Tax=Colletotrichum orchidophilum TaxID=1209926 RepID=A0A1G4BA51_9PEZI|nr:Sodium:neurotransmitter symporter family protein [Colletotrichum orchidophilum]OHE98294.1 Sodium:neurotransmitter symporter family protein [Colletotrichum orchidophilum]